MCRCSSSAVLSEIANSCCPCAIVDFIAPLVTILIAPNKVTGICFSHRIGDRKIRVIQTTRFSRGIDGWIADTRLDWSSNCSRGSRTLRAGRGELLILDAAKARLDQRCFAMKQRLIAASIFRNGRLSLR